MASSFEYSSSRPFGISLVGIGSKRDVVTGNESEDYWFAMNLVEVRMKKMANCLKVLLAAATVSALRRI